MKQHTQARQVTRRRQLWLDFEDEPFEAGDSVIEILLRDGGKLAASLRARLIDNDATAVPHTARLQ